MKTCAWTLLVCMAQVSAFAADADVKSIAIGRYLVPEYRLLIDAQPVRVAATPVRASPFVLAISQAAKKGIVEAGVEGYSEVLIQCQKTQSVVLTTPFLRSDSQQAHCYRF
jgi:hypothetical protein